MLKFAFACLLLVNGALLVFQFGWLDALVRGGHEPERLRNQINADKVRILSPLPSAAPTAGASSGASASASTATATSSGAGVNTATAATGGVAAGAAGSLTPVMARPEAGQAAAACIEIGNLTVAEGRRFETRLATLTLAQKPVRREVREESSHMVWIPPPPTGREGADKKSVELRRLGIRDFYVLQDMPVRHGISLGVFKTEEAARAHLAKLGEQGVRSARVVEHKMPLVRAAFRFAGIDEQTRQRLDRLRSEFPRHEQKQCSI
ncbi:SPOR domain-containing protein [Lacisediminimonas sp.]|uniref:SPOR domain-containing protein n=1 Tax=Lacisediminimonas sp. TaxID=3060582 RepID=UPI00271888E1|nr:SPOR domain-containing protein [Lacisediminimonas sp.]MDO8299374.1 SPOR domain-containing protein [Lacisediminimonas sp.]